MRTAPQPPDSRPIPGLDRVEFDDFFRAEFGRVARAASLVVSDGDLGRDMAQEAFVRVFVAWASIESLEHARRLVFVIALNQARSYLRKNRRVRVVPEVRVFLREPDPAERVDVRLAVRQAMRSLSANQRTCVVLVDYLGFEPAEAATWLGMHPGTLRVHLMRGRRHLSAQLTDTGLRDGKE